jgi:hypothetical protein
MSEYLRLARPYFLLLAIVTAARWILFAKGVAYETFTDKVSIVILTMMASLFYGAFCQRWRGFGVGQAILLGLLFGVTSQLVIMLSTIVSYVAHIDSAFNYPKALNAPGPVEFAKALGTRFQGLVSNPIADAIMGLIGWGMGRLLPEKK